MEIFQGGSIGFLFKKLNPRYLPWILKSRIRTPPQKKANFLDLGGGSIPTFTVFESLDINENEEEAVQKSDWYKKSLNERVKLRGKAKNKSNKKKKKLKHIHTQKTLINWLVIIIFYKKNLLFDYFQNHIKSIKFM